MQRVLTDIIHMMHRVLRSIHRHIELRHYDGCDSRVVKIDPPFRIRRGQQLNDLHLDPLGTHLSEVLRVSRNCRACFLLNIKIELGRKAHSPENAQGILIKSGVRVADASDQFVLKV